MTHLPEPMQVRTMLEELLGRTVKATTTSIWSPTTTDRGAVAAYTDRFEAVRSLALCDLALSAFVGTAIGLVPVGQAEAAIEDQDLPEPILENLHEVLNVCAGLLNSPDSPRVRLHSVARPGEPLPAHVRALTTVLGPRLDLELTIAGYGTGRLSFVGTA